MTMITVSWRCRIRGFCESLNFAFVYKLVRCGGGGGGTKSSRNSGGSGYENRAQTRGRKEAEIQTLPFALNTRQAPHSVITVQVIAWY